METAVLRMWDVPRRSGKSVSRFLAVFGVTLLFAGGSHAAQITWYSATASGGSDEPFISLLQGAGHTVTRFPAVAGDLNDAQIAQLNTADLIIVGRATGSGDFDDLADETNWNQRVTKKLMIMSAYLVRNNRLGWQTTDGVPDSGPTPLVASDPAHPVFSGVTFGGDGRTMANNYNIQIDRGTTQIAGTLDPGGVVIATDPAVANGIAIAEFPAGMTVTADNGSYVLPSTRYFFAGGSREADGGALTTAGQMDLTADGQRMFLNFVNYAVVPEPSAFALLALGVPLLLRRSAKTR
jgi:hypothetical protein